MRQGLPSPPRPLAANLQRAQAFLQAFLERAPNGYRFANTFHLRGERGVGLWEFLEGKARNLGDDVINARLEARGGFARDVVLEFVEPVAEGEFGVSVINLLTMLISSLIAWFKQKVSAMKTRIPSLLTALVLFANLTQTARAAVNFTNTP